MGLSDFLRRRRPADAFAERVMERLRERGWPHALSYDRKEFRIWLGPQAGSLLLHNSYLEWLAYPPEERSSALDLVVAPAFEMEEETQSFGDARERLLPLVRNSCDMSLEGRRPGPAPAVTSLAGPLSVLLGIDQPNSIRLLNSNDLDAWERSFDEVLDCALENLESRSPCRFKREEGGFYVSEFEDCYDASRLLLPRLFGQLELRGAPVAVVATRHCLAVAGRDDVRALNAMAAYVEDGMRDATRPISYAPLILENGLWSPFAPDDPDLSAIRALSARQRIWDYAKQQAVLNDEPAERDLFVATVDSSWDGDELLTWATWTKGVPTLLPRVDYLGVTDLKTYIFRRWEDVEAVCGPFEVEKGHVPVRYFVNRWPDPAAFARLKAEFEAPAWGPD